MPNINLSQFYPSFEYNNWEGGPTRAPLDQTAFVTPDGFVSVWNTTHGAYFRTHDEDGQAADGGAVLGGNEIDHIAVRPTDGAVFRIYQNIDTNGYGLRIEQYDEATGFSEANTAVVVQNEALGRLTFSDATFLPDGGFVAEWGTASPRGVVSAVYDAQVYNADFTERGLPSRFVNYPSSRSEIGDIVPFSDGSVAVVDDVSWNETLIDSRVVHSDVFLQRFDSAGVALPDPIRLTDGERYVTDVRAAVTENGGMVLATISDIRDVNGQSPTNAGIQLQFFDATNDATSLRLDAPALADLGGASAILQDLVVLPDGGIVLAAIGSLRTTTDGQVSYTYPIYVQYFDAAGSVIGDPLDIGPAIDRTSVSLDVLDNGRVLLSGLDTDTGFVLLQQNTMAEGTPTFTGTLAEGETLDASNIDVSALTDTDGLGQIADFSVQWGYLDATGEPTFLEGQSGSSLMLGDEWAGRQLVADVSFIDGGGSLERIRVAPSATVSNTNDAPTGEIWIRQAGTNDFQTSNTQTYMEQNRTYEADVSALRDIDNSDTNGEVPSGQYQWIRGEDSVIDGAIEAKYTATQADVGHTLSVRYSYEDSFGANEVVTAGATRVVGDVDDPLLGHAVVIGEFALGNTISFDTSALSDADGIDRFVLALYRADGDFVELFRGTSFTLDEQDLVGGSYYVDLAVIDDFNRSTLRRYQLGELQNTNDLPTGDLTVRGAAVEGTELFAESNALRDIDGLGGFSYQWQRDNVDIDGARGRTYQTQQSDVGTAVRVVVTYTDGFDTEERVESTPTALIANVDTPLLGTPVIRGTLTQGEIVQADVSSLSDTDGIGMFSYQWLRGIAEITGATSASFALTQADVDQEISIRVTHTDAFGGVQSVQSTGFARVENINDPVEGSVIVTGSPIENEVLMADTTTLADPDGLGDLSYQWFRDGVEIFGATLAEYRPGLEDVGNRMSVEVTYRDGGFTYESTTSALSNVIEALPLMRVGTVGDDTLQGGTAGDTMNGIQGNDMLLGGEGDDSLLGGEGSDTLVGNEGNDTLVGGDTETDLGDVAYGGVGNDSIDGGYGNDELRGDAGNDTIAGGFGADTIIGGTGNDALTGSAFGDLLFGGDGNDFINGGFGFDRVNGGTGTDKFFHLGIADHGADWIQDYTAEDDVLLYGGGAGPATPDDFLIQRAETANAGIAGVQEVFVTHIPTATLLWALVDGDALSAIYVQIGTESFDLIG